MYIDTHSHIYSDSFTGDSGEMLQRAWNSGVHKILMPAIDAATHEAMLALEEENPGNCLSMMGLHPCSVNERLDEELEIIDTYFRQRKFVAVGETGLDFYWDVTHKDQQYRAFEHQLGLAITHGIPVVIHSRESTDACIEVVASHAQKGLKAVFHCFGGTVEQGRKITDMGFYLGIGGVLTFKKSGLDAVLRELPPEKLLLETDAPYLAPVPYRGKRNEPSYIPLIAEKLSDVLNITVEEVALVTTQNAKKLFAI